LILSYNFFQDGFLIARINASDGRVLRQHSPVIYADQLLTRTYREGTLIFSEWKTGGKDSHIYYLNNNQFVLSQVNSDDLIQQLHDLEQITPEIRNQLNTLNTFSQAENSCAEFVEVRGQYTGVDPNQQSACHFWIDIQTGNIIKPTLASPAEQQPAAICQNDTSETALTLLAAQREQNGKPATLYFGTHPAHPALNDQSTRDIYIQQGIISKHIDLPKNSRIRVLGNQLFVSHQNGTKQAISVNGLSDTLEKIHCLSAQKTVMVQVINHHKADAIVTLPVIPEYETLIIHAGQGQTYSIDQMLWDNYGTIYIQGNPACIQINIHENDWLDAKIMNAYCLVFDQVKRKTLLIGTNSSDQANKTVVKIGQRRLLTC
jgi:hypothetical protein